MYVYVTSLLPFTDEGVSLTREYSVCVCNMLTPVHHEGVSLTREYSVCVCNMLTPVHQMKV